MAAFYADENFRLPVVEALDRNQQGWWGASPIRGVMTLLGSAEARAAARNCTESPERVKRNTC